MSVVAVVLVVLLTPIGPFICEAVACRDTPDPAYAGYWTLLGNVRVWPPTLAGRLLVTKDHRPWAVYSCQRVAVNRRDEDLWRCDWGGLVGDPHDP